MLCGLLKSLGDAEQAVEDVVVARSARIRRGRFEPPERGVDDAGGAESVLEVSVAVTAEYLCRAVAGIGQDGCGKDGRRERSVAPLESFVHRTGKGLVGAGYRVPRSHHLDTPLHLHHRADVRNAQFAGTVTNVWQECLRFDAASAHTHPLEIERQDVGGEPALTASVVDERVLGRQAGAHPGELVVLHPLILSDHWWLRSGRCTRRTEQMTRRRACSCEHAAMSWVATLMLSVDIFEDRALIEKFSHWLRTQAPRREPQSAVGVGFLEPLNEAPQGWGGWKNPEARLFGAVLNHADLAAVVRWFEQAAWRHPESVQMMVMDQEQFAFRVWMLQDGRAVQHIPLPDFGADD